LSTSLITTFRFRLIASIALFSWMETHAIVLTHYGYTWPVALLDSGISNLLLAAVAIVITITFQFYIPQKNKYAYIIALVVVLTLLWLFVSRAILLQLLSDKIDYNRFFSQSVIIRGVFGFLINGCMALVSVLWYTVQDQRETEKRRTEAEALAKEAELYNLRQQLQPHFLFNSLNSINALITLQPQQARTMIQQLSDFLRGTLKKEEHQWVSLADELQHLQLYLEIEKVRFGHRLSTAVINDTSAADVQIPAMLLQPVVENAIKFGLYDTIGDITISIETRLADGSLIVEVKNPYDPETSSPNKGTGFGLSSVQRRLYLLFARNDLLKTTAHEQVFTTTIKIPQQK
jgi:two-component system LytT family sensor kinase